MLAIEPSLLCGDARGRIKPHGYWKNQPAGCAIAPCELTRFPIHGVPDRGLTKMPSDPNPNTRVRIAFLCLFVFMVVLSVGAYFVADLRKLQDSIAARESQTALQGITDPRQMDEALRQHPSNKFLQMMAMATRAADETSAATEKLSNEVEPPAISKGINLGAASRSDLEALRRDLKTAEANATALMPRCVALLKTERANVEKYALSLHVDKDTISRLLDRLDTVSYTHLTLPTKRIV